MKRIVTMPAAVLLGLALLTACGDDVVPGVGGGGDYCETLKEAKKEFGSQDMANLDDIADRIQELRDQAPDEVQDDWEVLGEAYDEVLQALEDAGISQEDLEAMQKGETLSPEDMEAFAEAMAELESLNSEEVEKASDAISKHAKEECDVDLDV